MITSVNTQTRESTLDEILTAPPPVIQPMLLGGRQRSNLGELVQKIYTPTDHVTIIGECYQLPPNHVNTVARNAIDGFESYRKTAIPERLAILDRLANLLSQHAEPLTTLIMLEAGKPLSLARHEVQRGIAICRAYAQQWETLGSRTLYVDNREARLQLFPVGPVLAITPFNFPLTLILHKLCPAIAAGCSMTIKPAIQTPLTALYLGSLAVEAGYEAISVIPAPNETAELLVQSDAFAKLSFTGSAKVGWHLRQLANKKSVTLELGGNAAVVIEDLTSEVTSLAERCAFGAFAFGGQFCISVQRILVHDRHYDAFMEAFKRATRAIKIGDPREESTLIGPLISMDQIQRVRNIIKEAIQQGANVVYGGNTYNMFTMNPTILDRVRPNMTVYNEEVFAPIVTVESYADYSEALERVNSSRYGLQAGVYVQGTAKIDQAYQQVNVAGLMINDIPTYRNDLLPFGGIKDSGTGREGVMAGIADMSYQKVMVRT